MRSIWLIASQFDELGLSFFHLHLHSRYVSLQKVKVVTHVMTISNHPTPPPPPQRAKLRSLFPRHSKIHSHQRPPRLLIWQKKNIKNDSSICNQRGFKKYHLVSVVLTAASLRLISCSKWNHNHVVRRGRVQWTVLVSTKRCTTSLSLAVLPWPRRYRRRLQRLSLSRSSPMA